MEKETAEAVGRAVAENPGMLAVAGGGVLTLLGWLGRRLFGNIGHRITAASQAAASAAAAAAAADSRRRDDTIEIHRKLDGHIERDIDMHGQVLEQMREQTSALGRIHVSLEHALGERPTRDEVIRLIDLSTRSA